MLSGLTSYFFGAAEEETSTPDAQEVRLQVTAVEDEWSLVDRTNCAFSCLTKDGDCPCSHYNRLLLSNPGTSTPMEESWLVTPPSCFTAGGRSPDSSPMENLLIEHPSMSVYNTRARSAEAPPRTVTRQAPRRPRAVTSRAGLMPQTQLVKSMQTGKRRLTSKHHSRGHLDRRNKTYNLRSLDRHHRVQQPVRCVKC